jgi:hypothetical protein
MNSLNLANDYALAATEANDTAVLAALATTEANDTAAVAGSITELSKWALPSSYELGETGQALEMAIPLAASIVAARFALQGNVAQFDLQRKDPMPGSDELTDKKIELVEAHTDTKIERLGGKLGGKIDVLITKIDSLKDDVSKSDQYNRDTKLVLISMIVGVGLASVISISILLVALATYGDALFGRGMNVRDVVHAVITEQQEIQNRDTTQPPSLPPNAKQK